MIYLKLSSFSFLSSSSQFFEVAFSVLKQHLSEITSNFYFLFRNGSGSSGGTSGSRDQSPTYQNWSQQTNSTTVHSKNNKAEEKSKSGSDCTSSTECSEDSDRNSDTVNDSSKGNLVPTPAPRTTLEKSSPAKSSLQSSIRSISVERVKQVRHESLV